MVRVCVKVGVWGLGFRVQGSGFSIQEHVSGTTGRTGAPPKCRDPGDPGLLGSAGGEGGGEGGGTGFRVCTVSAFSKGEWGAVEHHPELRTVASAA